MSSFWSIEKQVKNAVAKKHIDSELESNFLVTCLYFAQLAYFDARTVYDKLQELNPLQVSLYNRKGTQGFFAEFKTFAIVSFRGREADHWQEINTDLKFWRTEWQGHEVHTGFLASLKHISRRIGIDIEEVDPNKRLVYTGHSLGGALSVLLALEHKPTDICTFGSPRVATDDEFVEYFTDINCVRVIVENDFVPDLPPKFIGYKDIGNLVKYPKRYDSKWESHKLRTYLRAVLKDEKTEDETP